ncbi:DUF5753 domain-containing protein [Nocardia jiangxiensis]|uniref:DUF5753 domain-containing protein n=1 Tax=Nocardia jiangxiensis TaxID=282685 RepID=UPI0005943029|nr:DUF5753 domain-containing protein [Nocardia jiangxiensis]
MAEQINLHHTTVSKMLKGEPCKLKPIYIDKMCDVYRATAKTRADLKSLAIEAESARDWWYSFNDVVSPDKLDVYINLESAATALTMYQSARIPGLLQTEEYARALLRTSPDLTPEEVERHIKVRMRRQAILVESDMTLNAILDESVIRRSLADLSLSQRHMERLVELSAMPNITIRLVPFDAGVYRGTEVGPFVILEFADPVVQSPDSPVVYVETGAGSGNLFLQKPDQVERYRRSWAEIERVALSAKRTRVQLSKIAKELPR